MSNGEILLIYWELKRKDCTGCAWDHPSQRRHECLMDHSNDHIYWKNAINTAYARKLINKSDYEYMLDEKCQNSL